MDRRPRIYPREGASMILAKVILLTALAVLVYMVANTPNYGGDWPPY